MEGRINLRSQFFKGFYHGIPIALGYLSVSFGFGIMTMKAGISALSAVGISLSNLTSAGQVAGVGVIAAGGTIVEIILTQIIINLRYSLMGISLSQKLSDNFSFPKRLIAAHGITDEIFAVAISQKEVTASYMYGLMSLPILGWSLGTLLGALFGQLLPESISNALGIMLYAMFVATIVPASRKEKSVLVCVITAAVLSVGVKYIIPSLSGGFSVIICSCISAAFCALVFPRKDEEGEGDVK